MHAFMNEFIPVVYNLIEFNHFDVSSKLEFLNHACSSCSLGTLSSAHFLGVLNLPPTDKIIDEGGSQDEHATSHERPPHPNFGICSRA